MKRVCYSNKNLCHVGYLPEALGCTATVSLTEEGGATDPDAIKNEGCTYTAMKNQNESSYTRANRASKLHNIFSSPYRANGEEGTKLHQIL